MGFSGNSPYNSPCHHPGTIPVAPAPGDSLDNTYASEHGVRLSLEGRDQQKPTFLVTTPWL